MHITSCPFWGFLLASFEKCPKKMSKLVGPFKKKDGKVVRWKKLENTALW